MTLTMKLDEARTEGRAEGIAAQNAMIALRLIADGLSAELVCKYTGLSLQEVEKLRTSFAGD